MRQIWTDARNEELRQLYRKRTGSELADHFGTTLRAIYKQANKLGLHKPQPNQIELTEERALWLKLNFPHMSNQICALILGISPRTVVRLARRMGINKTPQFMRECQAHTSKRAKESHLKNGTYPAKGYYSPNLQKGVKYQFRKKSDEQRTGKNNRDD